MTTASDRSRWLPFDPPTAGIRLYCLPHAGGSASAFQPWIGQLDGIAVCPVQPPGRDTRLGDAPHSGLQPLVEELAEVVRADAGNSPYAVYGHSFGALVGFELVHQIRRDGGPLPVHLLVSGFGAPPMASADAPYGLADEQIVELLRTLGGTPEVFLSDHRALRLILPPMRADLMVRNSYRYRPSPRLDVPITAIAATEDPQVAVEWMAEWRWQTMYHFQLRTLVGGHFAVLEQSATTLRHVFEALRPGVAIPGQGSSGDRVSSSE